MRIQLGNFPPKSTAFMKVFFYSKLEIEDLSWCLRLPATFTPRYLGNVPRFMTAGVSQINNNSDGAFEENKGEAVAEFARQTFAKAQDVGYSWNMTVEIISSGGQLD